MENDLLKIKEDAVKMQRNDLADTVKSIEMESTKSSFVTIFASSLLVFIKDSNTMPLYAYLIFLILLFVSIIVAFYNITSKKISIHSNVDEIFVKNIPKEWEKHLENKHLFLRNAYQDAKRLLYEKAFLTKLSFILIILSIFIMSIFKIVL